MCQVLFQTCQRWAGGCGWLEYVIFGGKWGRQFDCHFSHLLLGHGLFLTNTTSDALMAMYDSTGIYQFYHWSDKDLGGGFKLCFFSSPFGEDSHFDGSHIFQMGWSNHQGQSTASFFPVGLMHPKSEGFHCRQFTLVSLSIISGGKDILSPKTNICNIAAKNCPSQKERIVFQLPTINFQGLLVC